MQVTVYKPNEERKVAAASDNDFVEGGQKEQKKPKSFEDPCNSH
jgi:hypothetical protein